MHTYDTARVHDAQGNHMGTPLLHRVQMPAYKARDGRTIDHRVYDSTGAFLVGELERLDQTLHPPLAAVTWARDIDAREDVTIGDEASSYTVSTFGSNSGLGTGAGIGNGKAWMGKATNQVVGISVDIAKIPHPLELWGQELAYTIPELESAAMLGRPVDQQKYEGILLKQQMDIDEQVYIGDISQSSYGLVNSNNRSGADAVTNYANVANGASGYSQWAFKSPQEILADVNTLIASVWAQTGWAVVPSEIRIPPTQFGQISTQPITLAGSVSILKYLMENNLLTTTGRGKLNIQPLKWCIGAGVGGTIGTTGTVDRMVCYTRNKQYVRFPMTATQKTPLQYDSIWLKTTYFCRLGQVEIVYPDTVGYADAI
jgi:hypothetical protein